MRKFFAMAAIAVAALTANTMTAAAAWQCQGPAASCEKVSKGKKSAYKKSSGKSYASKTSKKSYSNYADNSGGYSISGKASYYWQPQRVASGGWFNPNAMTAAHKTLPFGTKVRVTNVRNGKSVVVTINDRGPYIKGRVIDLSRAAAQAISMTGAGVAPVSIAVLGKG